MNAPAQDVDILLFDLGGIFIRLTGVDQMMAWTGHAYSLSELWDRWLYSPAVRAFETGRILPETFAGQIVEEFSMPVLPEVFLDEFSSWGRFLEPGSRQLLQELQGSYRLASLSNTNPLHWAHMTGPLDLAGCFDKNFPSHETGKIKPDPEAFTHAAEQLDAPPERILFFDDTPANVESASQVGLHARHVQGIAALEAELVKLGIIAGTAENQLTPGTV